MRHISCRTEQVREKIVEKYNIELIQYTKLLKGHKLQSDAQAEITDIYYVFECMPKIESEKDKEEYIQVGKGAGEHFLRLLNIDKPILFNPLKEGSEKKTTNSDLTIVVSNNYDKTALQLRAAINLLLICWSRKKPLIPYGDLKKIKIYTENHLNRTPEIWAIKKINNIIGTDKKNRSLSEMIKELREQGNDFKDFSFDLLKEALGQNNIRSNF